MLAPDVLILEDSLLGFRLSRSQQGWEQSREPRDVVAWDGAGATAVHRDQGPEVSGREGEREPSALSLQSANKSLCILLPSFPFRPIFSVTN